MRGFLIYILSMLPLLAPAATEAVIGRPVVPALTHKDFTPAVQVRITRSDNVPYVLEQIRLSFGGTTRKQDIVSAALFQSARNGTMAPKMIGEPVAVSDTVALECDIPIDSRYITLWVALSLSNQADIDGLIQVNVDRIGTSLGNAVVKDTATVRTQRIGVAVRQPMQDGVYCSRIPGLATARDGSLLAVYDARHESARDLQGDMDIAVQRSVDGGATWQPLQRVLDMGRYGGLPERYNGVSDGNVLVDDLRGTVFVAGTWMYGIPDPYTGVWVEGIDDSSTIHNHHTSTMGSLPGFGEKQTAQFLIARSTDNGITWSKPVNITRAAKREADRFFSPCPGRGITMRDGTLVMPVQCRDSIMRNYASIIYSRDGGENWTLARPAGFGGGESAVVELDDGSLMLNQHRRDNYRKVEGNGRYIMVTSDMGQTWREHPTSRSALIEPPCEASLHKHCYRDSEGMQQSLLLFVNPNSYTSRNNITLQVSFDDGQSWSHKLLLDQFNGSGYSCITSLGEEYIGVLYEGSQANLQFQRIPLKDILDRKKQ